MLDEPYPAATDYWRTTADGVLWRVTGTYRSPLDEEGNVLARVGLSPSSAYDDGHVYLKSVASGAETTLSVAQLHAEAELVWTDYPRPDATLDQMRDSVRSLYDLKDLAHALAITGHDLEGRKREQLRVISEATESLSGALAKITQEIVFLLAQSRREGREAARRALNDELGIPNCDHLVPEPDCPECQKERA